MSPDPQQPQSQHTQNKEAQHPPEFHGTSRRATEKLDKPKGFSDVRRRHTNDSAIPYPQRQGGSKEKPVQESYSSYNLTWDALRGFLENKWPGGVFVAQHVSNITRTDCPLPAGNCAPRT